MKKTSYKLVSYMIRDKEILLKEIEGVYFKFPYIDSAYPPKITKWEDKYWEQANSTLPENIKRHFDRLPFYKEIPETDVEILATPIGVHKIYLDEDKNYRISNGHIIIRFKDDFEEAKAEKIIKDNHLDIIMKLGFAPFLYQVFDLNGRDIIDLANKLAAREECLYVEPTLLSEIGPRS